MVTSASSGNFADWLPNDTLAPARWDTTIAVGAELGFEEQIWENVPGEIWEYSQPANVVMPGAWYYFDTDNRYRAGTSFATPYVTMAMGLYLGYPLSAGVCPWEISPNPVKDPGVFDDLWFWEDYNTDPGNLPFACDLADVPYGGPIVTTGTDSVSLAINKTVGNNSVPVGAPVDFSITVKNEGSELATRVKLIDRLPDGLDYDKHVLSHGVYNPKNGVWYIGELDPGDTATLDLVAFPPPPADGQVFLNIADYLNADQEPSFLTDAAGVAIGVPYPPTDVNASADSRTAITLTWTDTSDETSFQIQQGSSPSGPWQNAGATAADVTSFSDSGLSCASTYYYRVRSERSGDLSPWSDPVGVTTDPCVLNPSFELPLGGNWSLITSGGGPEGVISNPQAFDGSQLLLLNANSAQELIRQEVPLAGQTNDQVELTFYVAGQNVSSGGLIGTRLELRSGGSNVGVGQCLVANRGTFNWTEITCTATAAGAFDSAHISIGWRNISSGLLGIDAVSITRN
ncbi:MAG: hypothetical protein ACFB51_17375 [Anaerolineae bacterium]